MKAKHDLLGLAEKWDVMRRKIDTDQELKESMRAVLAFTQDEVHEANNDAKEERRRKLPPVEAYIEDVYEMGRVQGHEDAFNALLDSKESGERRQVIQDRIEEE